MIDQRISIHPGIDKDDQKISIQPGMDKNGQRISIQPGMDKDDQRIGLPMMVKFNFIILNFIILTPHTPVTAQL